MSSKLVTPEFRASYTRSVFVARKANEKSDPKYSIVALFTAEPNVPPGSVTFEAMKQAALAAALERFGDTEATRKAIKSGKIKMPFRKNDEGKYPDEYPVYVTLSSNADYKPGVVDRFKGPDGKPVVITDPDVLYSGCLARASVKAFAYDTAGNKGVAFALNNVQKTGEGERLDNREKATDAFDALDEGAPGADDLAGGGDDDDDPMGLGV